jgi:putative ABC transport system ATP-binding protein
MTDQRYVLKARGLSKRFGEGETIAEAVRGVNLMLGPGEIVLMMGLSGTGKTTLLSMLGALLRPTDGDLRLVDVWLNELTERELPALRANRIGFIFQDFNLMLSLTARERRGRAQRRRRPRRRGTRARHPLARGARPRRTARLPA